MKLAVVDKKYFFSIFSNNFVRFVQTNSFTFFRSVNSSKNDAYQNVKLYYNDKLQNLENSLETMEKLRADNHKNILQKVSPKISNLKKCICNKNSDILLVGSVATGLTTFNTSDVDLNFIILNDDLDSFFNDFISNDKFKRIFSNKVINLITNDTNIWNSRTDSYQYVLRAKIPILKVNFANSLKFDILFCNSHSLKNTNLLKHYAASDVRFRKLYIFIKLLALKFNLIDGKAGLLTSYQISLLVAHFLQTSFSDQQPVLPLIPDVFSATVSPDIPIEKVIEHLKKPVDVKIVQHLVNPDLLASHLAVQFFDYYASFDFNTNAIYIDKNLPVLRFQYSQNPKIQIFDPYSDETRSQGKLAFKAFKAFAKNIQLAMKTGQYISSFPYFDEKNSDRIMNEIHKKFDNIQLF